MDEIPMGRKTYGKPMNGGIGPMKKVKGNIHLICSDSIDVFIKKFG
jgi:hypothetical protein